MFTFNKQDFGDFTFGAATAAYQIEGGQTEGQGMSIWDSFAATGRNVAGQETGEIACDHYNRWPEDLDLLKEAGFDAYRFSFAWPRILPQGTGAINQAGLDFYDRLIDGMLERNLKPFATLYHWDLPSTLQDKGGWLNRDIANWLADYAELVYQKFGDRLAKIATINEPWCVSFLSHYLGVHAPGYRDLRATARAMHHVLLAHGTTIERLRSLGAKDLGIVLNLEFAKGATESDEDKAAADLWDSIYNKWFLGGVFKQNYPQNVMDVLEPYMPDNYQDDMPTIGTKLDWLGINYYTRSHMKHDASVPNFQISSVPGPLEKTDLGWEIYPQGLTELLKRVAKDYTDLPLYVTENGLADAELYDDQLRVKYYDQHYKAALQAKQEGVDLRGYFAWSLLDNYEWAEGYDKRFGMVHVDYETQKRTPKSSYRAFQKLLKD
ncbi:GH1 family beta-glucosidase [Maritalea porphyrae]|uniref:Beta-glucosidase n=1 Tax=Maritalea porphyrae TaxID=880732 RepID=A0ABQ5UQX5_9HYPH|nr:GH1 family beta-glucosidase [Maritalea porphyrae]GLQ17673.1 beta-glucosidase [Maritalea porphyrae]